MENDDDQVAGSSSSFDEILSYHFADRRINLTEDAPGFIS